METTCQKSIRTACSTADFCYKRAVETCLSTVKFLNQDSAFLVQGRSFGVCPGRKMLGCSVSIAVVRADQWYGCVTKIRQNTTKPGNFEGYTVYIDMSYSIIQPYEVYGILVPFLQHLQQTWHMVKLYLYLLHGTKVWSTYVGKRLKTWGNMSIHLDVL